MGGSTATLTIRLRTSLDDGFRPHIVNVSGHGHYDDLRGEYYE
jgi:hypothetical protein